MAQDFGSVTVEEHVHGDTLWVAVRARGAEWSWLTQEDALRLARHVHCGGLRPDQSLYTTVSLRNCQTATELTRHQDIQPSVTAVTSGVKK
jgi:hypothetical protein